VGSSSGETCRGSAQALALPSWLPLALRLHLVPILKIRHRPQSQPLSQMMGRRACPHCPPLTHPLSQMKGKQAWPHCPPPSQPLSQMMGRRACPHCPPLTHPLSQMKGRRVHLLRPSPSQMDPQTCQPLPHLLGTREVLGLMSRRDAAVSVVFAICPHSLHEQGVRSGQGGGGGEKEGGGLWDSCQPGCICMREGRGGPPRGLQCLT
jgi:hypothetical protein